MPRSEDYLQPDTKFDPVLFADDWWAFRRRQSAFEDHLLYLSDDDFDFTGIGTDNYDLSLEIYGVSEGLLLNADQQKLIFDCGFRTVFVNRVGGGAYYHWGYKEDFHVITAPSTCSSRGG